MGLAAVLELRPRAVLPPIWRELGPALRRDTPRAAAALAAAFNGGGRPVLLVPGFLSGDASLRPPSDFLAAAGYAPRPVGIVRNAGCSEAALAVLERRLEREAAAWGQPDRRRWPQPRWDVRARARRPPAGARLPLVTLGSPQLDQLAVHPLVWASAIAVGLLGSVGADGVLRLRCASGACCADFRRDLASPPPEAVRSLALFSRADGVVDWRSCLDPGGRSLEVAAGHFAMVHDPVALNAVAHALAEADEAPAEREAPVARTLTRRRPPVEPPALQDHHRGVAQRNLGGRSTLSRQPGRRPCHEDRAKRSRRALPPETVDRGASSRSTRVARSRRALASD